MKPLTESHRLNVRTVTTSKVLGFDGPLDTRSFEQDHILLSAVIAIEVQAST